MSSKIHLEKTQIDVSKLCSSMLIVLNLVVFSPQLYAQSYTQKSGPAAGAQIGMKRGSTQLPTYEDFGAAKVNPRNVSEIKPPRSSQFYESSSKEAQYEKAIDDQIRELYKLSQNFKRSRTRGEIWLRLAEKYVEKARLIDFREQAVYDQQMKAYLEKKSRVKPKQNSASGREYHEKAVQLYDWFVADFPTDKKIDQAFFFLGYNYFELGNPKKGEEYYNRLVQQYPDSSYVTESHFALAEYYFENDKWEPALENYRKVVQENKTRLGGLALYKAAWCYFRLGRASIALKALEKVVELGQGGGDNGEGVGSSRAVNKYRLTNEALRDYVPFYAEGGDFKKAPSEFRRVSGSDAEAAKMTERLAFIYSEAGSREAASYLFKYLIAQNPNQSSAANFQFQIVNMYSHSDQKIFREEMRRWVESFGPQSSWAQANAGDKKLIEDTYKVQEATLRGHVLQLHQTAQNSRADYSRLAAVAAYQLYGQYFSDSPKGSEMRFYQAELYFDMEKYQDAAKLYFWVAEKDPKSKFFENSVVNAMLALEKDLPSNEEIAKKRGTSLAEIPLDPPVMRFERAALKYISSFPKGDKVNDIRRRLGVLYYHYNHFDQAIALFDKVIEESPGSQNAEVAGNLTLDIYKLKGDMVGLADKGKQYLSNPALAKTKFGMNVHSMMEGASFSKAEKLAETKDYTQAAKEFESFGATFKQSELSTAAKYKAGYNYEKAGDFSSAIRMHLAVLAVASESPKIRVIQNDSRNDLSRLYQQSGQLELAAKYYQAYGQANSKDQKGVNAIYNAAVLFDALNDSESADINYQSYQKLSSKSDRSEVAFLQAEMHKRLGHGDRAVELYNQYLTNGNHPVENILRSIFMVGQIYENAQKPQNRWWYKRTIETAKTLKAKDGLQYVAEAKFRIAQDSVVELATVRFGRTEKQQQLAAQKILQIKDKYILDMKEVIKYDNAPMIVAALASAGQVIDQIAALFGRAPTPDGYSPEDAQKFQQLLADKVKEFKAEAQVSYKAASDKASEFEVFTPWAKVAQQALKKDSGGVNEELAAEAKAIDWMGL